MQRVSWKPACGLRGQYLRNCPPSIVNARPAERADRTLHVCNVATICPWCWARLVVKKTWEKVVNTTRELEQPLPERGRDLSLQAGVLQGPEPARRRTEPVRFTLLSTGGHAKQTQRICAHWVGEQRPSSATDVPSSVPELIRRCSRSFSVSLVEEQGVAGLLRELPIYAKIRPRLNLRTNTILTCFDSWVFLAAGNNKAALGFLTQASTLILQANQQPLLGDDEADYLWSHPSGRLRETGRVAPFGNLERVPEALPLRPREGLTQGLRASESKVIWSICPGNDSSPLK